MRIYEDSNDNNLLESVDRNGHHIQGETGTEAQLVEANQSRDASECDLMPTIGH